jgi:histidine transport system permease protein
MFFSGYGHLVLEGAWVTVKLSIASLLLAVGIGLSGASARLSSNRLISSIGTVYTTLVRGIPDLVLMLLLFYSLQILLNHLTDCFGLDQIDIDPFGAGIIVLGLIYGAYFTETFRGAFLSVPRGQLEAGAAYGMSGRQVFTRIMFPQMMRFALPGLANNWLVLVKSTALVSIIGLQDVVKVTQDAGKGSMRFFFFTLLAGAIYLLITTVSNVVLRYFERLYSIGIRAAQL